MMQMIACDSLFMGKTPSAIFEEAGYRTAAKTFIRNPLNPEPVLRILKEACEG